MRKVIINVLFIGALKSLGSVCGTVLTFALAWSLGAGNTTDALFAAMLFPVGLWQNTPAILGQVTIPYLTDKSAAGKERFLRTVTTLLWIAGGTVMLLCMASPETVVGVVAAGLNNEAAAQAATYLRILAPLFPATLFSAFFQANFHARKKFMGAELAFMIWKITPVVAVGAAICVHADIGLWTAWGFTAAGLLRLLHLAVLSPGQTRLLLLRPSLRLRNTVPYSVRHLFLSESIIVASDWTLETFTRFLGSLLPLGGLSIFSYADKLSRTLPIQLIRSFGTVLLPDLAGTKSERERESQFFKVLLLCGVFGAGCSLVIHVAAPLLAKVVFLSGSVGPAKQALLARTIVFLAPSIFAMMVTMVCQLKMFLGFHKRVFLIASMLQTITLFVLWRAFGLENTADLALYITISIYMKMAYFLYIARPSRPSAQNDAQ